MLAGPEYFFVRPFLAVNDRRICRVPLFRRGETWRCVQSQWLPGGWVLRLDDVLAAAYVNAVALAMCWMRG